MLIYYHIRDETKNKISTAEIRIPIINFPEMLTEMTFFNYITWKRIIPARNLIQRTVQIKNAVVMCGFNGYTTFYQRNYKYPKVSSSYNHTMTCCC